MPPPVNALDTPDAPPHALRRFAELPGPRSLPVVGNALQIRKLDMHNQLEGWSRQYGGAFRMNIGRRDMLVLPDHALIATALRDRPDRFRRPIYSGRVLREMGFEEGLFFVNDAVWQRQRRMVMAGFDPGHVKAYFPSLLTVVGRLQRRWAAAAASGRATDLQADLMRYTVDAVAGLAFGAEVNTLESDGDVIQAHLNRIFAELFRRVLAPVRWWRFVKLPADRRLDASVAAVNAAIAGFITDARARLAADPARRERPQNLLEAMVVAADTDGSGLDDDDVAGNVLVLLLAGEDTTANTLAWALQLLHRNPEALARAREEVRRHAPDAAAFTPEQMAALDWVEACCHETMRLKPVAPLIAAQAVRDTSLGDIEVPAETIVMGLLRHDTLEERHFPDATAFKPERWLGGGASASAAKRVSMPFGAGPRVCPGRYLALMEMKLALAMVLGSFEIAEVATAEGREAPEQLLFTMAPRGLLMRLRPREAAPAGAPQAAAVLI
jgi:cytochrome P450